SLSFAKRAGLDLAQTRDMLSQGAAGSWAFENYGPKILAADWSPGFKIAHQNKDFRYTLAVAKNLDAAVPMTQLCLQLLEKLEQEGHADWTTCALYAKMLEMGFVD
ncbi:MAG: NAD(P)-dependent oxidoreductase, partial [Chthonomonas sp.]|nr:NAD(P)-dependent oxidoreductase [Chthonomonas sp.]